jgi:hypothetical protein
MPGTMSIPRTGPKLSAGVLTADLTRLGDELAILRGTGCWAHVDVMDGSFCPQLTVGPGFVAAVAAAGIPVDAHLLVDEPRRLLPDIVAAGPAGNLDRMLAQLSMAPERSTDDQQRPEREDRGPAHPDEDHPDRGGGP